MVVWNLSDLVSGNVEAELGGLHAKAQRIARWKPRLARITRAEFSRLLGELEKFHVHSAHVFAHVHLRFAEKTNDVKSLARESLAEQVGAKIENELRFFSLWWKRLPAKRAKELGGGREDISYYLESVRKYRRHTLSDGQETVIALKDTTGSSTLMNVYQAMTNAFSYPVTVKGKTKRYTREELTQFIYGDDANLRRQAYDALLDEFRGNRAVLGEVYRSTVMDWHHENLSLRKYGSVMGPRNLDNDMPDEAVDALLSACRKNVGVFQRYYVKKAKTLGVKKLRRYDIYAPLQARESNRSFDAAKKMVLGVFGAYSARMRECAQAVFDAGHVHSEVSAGKRDGAFCLSPSPKVLPYVLLSYTGKLQDVSTLAHEMGHAVHTVLASTHSAFTFHAPLPLAETASIFSETMLMRELLKSARGRAREALLVQQMDHLYASIMRQAFFVEFERAAHRLVPQGASIDDLDALYVKNLKVQFGGSVKFSDAFRNEWLCIPHIFETPFYCYAYAFGNLLSLALIGMLDREGLSFMPKIERVFAWGGSESPARILKEIGVDICSERFWQTGFDVIAQWVDEL